MAIPPMPEKPQLSERLRQRRARLRAAAGQPPDAPAQPAPGWAPLRGAFLAAVAIAALLRLGYLWEYHRDPTWTLAILDQLYNADLAKAIASGTGAPAIPYFRPPGYVYFLAALQSFGAGLGGVRVAQALIGALGCGLIALLAGRLWRAPLAAWTAGLAAAVWGPLIVTDAELLSPVLIVPLNAVMLIALVEASRGGGWRWWVAGGIAGGLSAIVRPDVLPFLPLGALATALLAPERGRAVRGAFLFAACAIAMIAPVTIRNARVGGEAVLIATSGGVNFHIGNNPKSDGLSVILPERTQWGGGWEDFRAMAEQEAGRPMTWKEAERHFYAKGLRTWREQPAAMATLFGRKLFYFWHGLEVLSSRDDYAARHYSRIARLLLWPRGVYFPFGLLAPLTLAAAWWAFRREPAARLPILCLLVYWLAVSAFFVTGRFRLPILPAALALSAGLVAAIVEAVRAGGAAPLRSREFAIPLLIAAAAMVALNWPYAGIWKAGSRAQYFYMAGTALQNDGRHTEAIPYLTKAWEEDPSLGDAALFLGDAYRAQEDYAAAEAIYRRLLEREPRNGSLELWLGEVLTLQGRGGEARGHLERAVELTPHLFDARMGLGVLLTQQGEMDAARAQFLAANDLRPHPAVKVMLGTMAASEGKQTEAEMLYREALSLEPENSRASLGLAEILADTGRPDEARAALQKAFADGEQSARARALATRLGM